MRIFFYQRKAEPHSSWVVRRQIGVNFKAEDVCGLDEGIDPEGKQSSTTQLEKNCKLLFNIKAKRAHLVQESFDEASLIFYQ